MEKCYPDFTQSTLNDVMGCVQNDEEKAKIILRGFSEQEKEDKEKKVFELQEQFPLLSKEFVVQILEKNKYDVDSSIVPLFNKNLELQKENEKKQREEEKKKRSKEETERRQQQLQIQLTKLMEIFHTIPKETVQKILDENEGDIEETTNSCLDLVSKQQVKQQEILQRKNEREEMSRKLQEEQEERMRSIKIDALKEKFPELTVDQISEVLVTNKWDIKESCKKLMILITERKKLDLKSLFPGVEENEIQDALESHDWNMALTAKALEDFEKKKREENERQKLEEKQKKEAKNERPESKKEGIEKKGTNTVIIRKIQDSLLNHSIILGIEIEDQVMQEAESQNKIHKEEAIEEFRKRLGHVIAVQAQNGVMPGVVPPPLPKQIDVLIGKKGPVDDDINEEVKKIEREIPVKNFPPGKNGELVVVLSAEPSVVDCGNTINLNWEIISGISNPSDWVGFFAEFESNKHYVTYEWRGKQEKKGTLSFLSPNSYGTFEFRYFPSSSYEHVAVSNKVTIGPQIELNASLDKISNKVKVSWVQKSGNQYKGAWCGLFEKGKDNKQYITWEYATSSNLEFEAPIKPATYEIRFFPQRYFDVARSGPLVIEGEDRISAQIDNNIITVKMESLLSVNPAVDSVWLGVFLVEQTDNRLWRRYKWVGDRTSNVTFKAPRTKGTYNVRLFANKNFDCITSSNSFII